MNPAQNLSGWKSSSTTTSNDYQNLDDASRRYLIANGIYVSLVSNIYGSVPTDLPAVATLKPKLEGFAELAVMSTEIFMDAFARLGRTQ